MPASPRDAPPSDELQVHPVAELDGRQLGQLELVYAQAFPAHLRVPLPELAAPGPQDQLLAGLLGDDVAAFAALRLLETVGWVFLRYYGVATQRRRRRLGLRFWQLLTPSLAMAGWPARIAFWESCGAVTLPVPRYVMPALTPLGAAEPMILMAARTGGSESPDPASLAELVRAIYAEHYRLEPDHSLITAALSSIAAGNG